MAFGLEVQHAPSLATKIVECGFVSFGLVYRARLSLDGGLMAL